MFLVFFLGSENHKVVSGKWKKSWKTIHLHLNIWILLNTKRRLYKYHKRWGEVKVAYPEVGRTTLEESIAVIKGS